jgi:hypothetical protein
MTMESPKATYEDGKMIIEGEFDIEVELSGMHPAFPPEDEELFNKCPFEIKSYGEINLEDSIDIVRWINKKNVYGNKDKKEDPTKWPKWRITLERI